MDIHHEVDHIIANLSQPPQLRFEFHQNGATIILCKAQEEHKFEMTPYQLLTLEQLFTFGGEGKMMQSETIAYFTEEPQP